MLGENIWRDSWVYALAAHEYYWGDGQHHIISDEEYDALTKIIQKNWSEVPFELHSIFESSERLGQGASHIFLNHYLYKMAKQQYEVYLHERRSVD